MHGGTNNGINTHKRILAIDPGARQIGVAVFGGEELLYYSAKDLRRYNTLKNAPGEARKVITHFIAGFEPQMIAIKQPFSETTINERLTLVTSEIEQVAIEHAVTMRRLAPQFIRQFICGKEKATKRNTRGKLIVRYRELAHYEHGRTKWEQRYYARMFEAVATGLTCVLNS